MSDRITIPAKFAQPILSQIKKAEGWQGHNNECWYVDVEALLTVCTIAQLTEVKKNASKAMDEKVPAAGALYRMFRELEKRATTMSQLKQAAAGTFDPSQIQVYTLKDLELALKDAIKKSSKNCWIYVKLKDYLFTPVFVDSIVYYAPSRTQTERVELHVIAVCGRAEPQFCTDTFNIYRRVLGEDSFGLSRDDAQDDTDDDDDGETRVVKQKVKKSKGAALDQVIRRAGFYLSNQVLEEEYAKNYEAYAIIADKVGPQYVPVDPTIMCMAIDNDDEHRWWSSAELTSLTVDDVPSRVIIDDGAHEDYASHFDKATGFAIKDDDDLEDVGNYWNIKAPVLPTMPVVRVFNLQSGEHGLVAANSIKPYAYDDSMWQKLILPEDDMDFIQILLSSTSVNISDIIRGKARGIIVVGSGGPGLGKTLTAEAASEAFKKPFYSVQCSQLGIDPEELEKNLLKALSRAARWEAILLLDEADVYVRKRGDDIQQNAIVGVFLRVLEYYRGILFMTTNLGNDIDDAILSRATAHLHYEVPTTKLIPKLWEVLSKQLTVDFTDDDINRLSNHFGQLPGRSIRNLIKLTKYYAVAKKKKPTYETVVKISRYLNVKALATKDAAV
jgi:ATPase family protein associated with various cellular activities (AAA)